MGGQPRLSSLYYRQPRYGSARNDFPAEQIRLFGYARQALLLGLRSCGLKPGSRILFPEFICRDLLSVAFELGAQPVFYPVDERFRPSLDPMQWPAAEAVVAVNYFGFSQPLGPFQLYCHNSQAVLVEDNAHGYLSQESSGEWLGFRGDIGIFSFRKSIPTGLGAGLYLKPGIAVLQEGLACSDSRLFVHRGRRRCRALFGSLLSSVPIAALAVSAILSRRRGGLSGPWLTDSPECEQHVPESINRGLLIRRKISAIDIQLEVDRRRQLYDRLSQLSAEVSGISSVFGGLDSFTVPYMFVFNPDNDKSLAAFTKILTVQGLRYVRWPDLPLSVRENCPDFYKNIWAVPFLW